MTRVRGNDEAELETQRPIAKATTVLRYDSSDNSNAATPQEPLELDYVTRIIGSDGEVLATRGYMPATLGLGFPAHKAAPAAEVDMPSVQDHAQSDEGITNGALKPISSNLDDGGKVSEHIATKISLGQGTVDLGTASAGQSSQQADKTSNSGDPYTNAEGFSHESSKSPNTNVSLQHTSEDIGAHYNPFGPKLHKAEGNDSEDVPVQEGPSSFSDVLKTGSHGQSLPHTMNNEPPKSDPNYSPFGSEMEVEGENSSEGPSSIQNKNVMVEQTSTAGVEKHNRQPTKNSLGSEDAAITSFIPSGEEMKGKKSDVHHGPPAVPNAFNTTSIVGGSILESQHSTSTVSNRSPSSLTPFSSPSLPSSRILFSSAGTRFRLQEILFISFFYCCYSRYSDSAEVPSHIVILRNKKKGRKIG